MTLQKLDLTVKKTRLRWLGHICTRTMADSKTVCSLADVYW